ncbi:MAG: hypothetical protein IJ634_02970 [Bacteroidales bacterium]|nr:hypothetical protein [Bacteroidales bacterium]
MKKNIFALAAAVLMLGMTACQKEDEIITNAPETGNTLMVKSVADLAGTEWTYTLTFADMIGVQMPEEIEIEGLDLEFGLNFDGSYAHLVFPESVIGLNVVEDGEDFTVEEIQGIDYTYTYDATTQTGALSGGNLVDIEIPFHYDEDTDAIVVEFAVSFDESEENAIPVQLVFHRAVVAE